MVTLFGVFLVVSGFNLLKLSSELHGLGYFLVGILLIIAGGYIFGYSFSLAGGGAAYG